MPMTMEPTTPHVASPSEWLTARLELLRLEKAMTRQLDELSAKRRRLPWLKVEKAYRFEGREGTRTLADLFGGRSQLIIKHFMFGPEWDEGCVGCSFGADHFDAARVHLEHHDVACVMVSRAPWSKLEPFQRRMGWKCEWVSSHGSDFNFDYHVSFTPEEVSRGEARYNYARRAISSDEASGLSVFARGATGEIFHTYSTYGRGDELLLGAYVLLDLTPKGRNETGPYFSLMDWVRHHDRYDAPPERSK